MDKLPFAILGFSLVIYGISVCLDPTYYSRKFGRVIDFTGISLPYGLFAIAVGLLLLWCTLRRK